MFGYIRADRPYLYMKDDVLYKAMYCGVCKGISSVCGQTARMGLSYDVTFLSIILHNIAGVDVKIEKSHCLTHVIRAKPMAQVDEITRMLGAVNTELVYYKYTDDINDGDKGRGKRLWFVKGHKRAQKAYPEISRIIKERLAEQEEREKSGVESLDIAADATANILCELSGYILGEKRSAYTDGLFYLVGKWIYLIDALDDYDKDVKKGAYNPFVLTYKKESKRALIESHAEEIGFTFESIFAGIRENLEKIPFRFNRDLSDNILLRGIPAQTKRIIGCADCACKKGEQ
ncbi:MAG: hypothetical protein IJV80_05550 [Clostridia bacterium]|nr:hypothetical protein [Clostridia bacterium]